MAISPEEAWDPCWVVEEIDFLERWIDAKLKKEFDGIHEVKAITPMPKSPLTIRQIISHYEQEGWKVSTFDGREVFWTFKPKRKLFK